MGLVQGVHAEAQNSGKEAPEMAHQEYKPGRHGFAVRGNSDSLQEKKCLVDSVTQVLTWLGHTLHG